MTTEPATTRYLLAIALAAALFVLLGLAGFTWLVVDACKGAQSSWIRRV